MLYDKRAIGWLIGLSLLVLFVGACAAPTPAAMPKPTDAMMEKPTDAMMEEPTDAMMEKPTDAMTEKPTDAAMMEKPTDAAMMDKPTDAMMEKPTDAMMEKPTDAAMMDKFPETQIAAHFVDSSPMHEQVLDKLPEAIVLNFNFTLDPTSTIEVTKDGQMVKVGAPVLGDKRLSMSTPLPADLGPGLYVVKYKACWPDKSCHDGLFAFKVAAMP